jgi:DNA gyrase/topoisomerase IV subunit A
MKHKSRDLTKPKHKEKIIRLPISKFINSKYRDYAVYVLESRGIPSFFDALTSVQRYILKNTPSSFVKTLTVVGKSIQDGYHHGPVSLEGAINKLTRPFGNALQILEGYGFFGTEVSPSPAAARYTSVKLSSTANSILNKYSYLTTRDPDGPYDPFWMDIPLGLVSPIVGIAVGYKTTILPRKLKDIQDFLEGKRKSVKPYFEGFEGSIEKYKGVDKAWLISSNITTDIKKIMIREIPPILKYNTVLKKLDNLINRFESNIRIVNNSNTKVNIDIIYNGRNKEEWEDILKFVNKVFSIIVTENLVFIKDGQVLTYDSVEQYLEDYKWQIVRLKLKNTEYERNKLDFELRFNQVKELFIEFILTKKRSNDEITAWFKKFVYDKEIIERLERMTTRKFTLDELSFTKNEIKRLDKELKEKEKELLEAKKEFDKFKDPTIERGIGSKKNIINLFEVDDIIEDKEGIVIWDGQDVYDENTQNEIDEE